MVVRIVGSDPARSVAGVRVFFSVSVLIAGIVRVFFSVSVWISRVAISSFIGLGLSRLPIGSELEQWPRGTSGSASEVDLGFCSGSIGFLGLMVPHLCRPWVRASPSKLLPVCALTGGNLLLVADMLIRSFSHTQELKLGVITSLIGAPFLLIVVYRMRRTLI